MKKIKRQGSTWLRVGVNVFCDSLSRSCSLYEEEHVLYRRRALNRKPERKVWTQTFMHNRPHTSTQEFEQKHTYTLTHTHIHIHARSLAQTYIYMLRNIEQKASRGFGWCINGSAEVATSTTNSTNKQHSLAKENVGSGLKSYGIKQVLWNKAMEVL